MNKLNNIWYMVAFVVIVTALATVFGWLDWSDEKPVVNETAPVSIDAAVESGGLELHPY